MPAPFFLLKAGRYQLPARRESLSLGKTRE
jgi:hypothetical protein